MIGKMNIIFYIALYIRLSKEDLKEGEDKEQASESLHFDPFWGFQVD